MGDDNYFLASENFESNYSFSVGEGDKKQDLTAIVEAEQKETSEPEPENSSLQLNDILRYVTRGGLPGYAPSGPEFAGKIVKFTNYGMPFWLLGEALVINDAGQRIAEINETNQDMGVKTQTVYHEAAFISHLGGKDRLDEVFNTEFNKRRVEEGINSDYISERAERASESMGDYFTSGAGYVATA